MSTSFIDCVSQHNVAVGSFSPLRQIDSPRQERVDCFVKRTRNWHCAAHYLPGSREPDVAKSTRRWLRWRGCCCGEPDDGCGGEEGCGSGVGEDKKLAKKRKNAKKKAAETGNRTSPTMACVRNLGTRHVFGADSGKFLPTGRDERQNRPTHQRIMTLLSMAVVPEERIAFRRRFVKAMRGGDAECRELLCLLP
ncbi:hypothetical protein MHU86_22076 [Fragilaria crotonensis]|nr:hypothetical protein MHU86_22076 [Fragilaria crotonensis]